MATMAGFHHITAIASDPQRNLDFYAGLLGQRLVKRTVNFDAPETYHFYFADYAGSPGTVLTFFPWPKARRGVVGSGEAAAVAYHVPAASLQAWQRRLADAGVEVGERSERFGQPLLPVRDPDGVIVELVGSDEGPAVQPWAGGPVAEEMALRGFHSTTLLVRDLEASAALLRDEFGWSEAGREGAGAGARTRYAAPGAALGRFVDLVERPDLPEGRMGAGTIHHVAFRTPDDAAQLVWREQLVAAGFGVTPVRDRSYFHSIYFREPNGVLYEIATDAPGFATDEPLEALGEGLRLPPWLEKERSRLQAVLPQLQTTW